jgi:uncharacterized protein (TIGR02145 family)
MKKSIILSSFLSTTLLFNSFAQKKVEVNFNKNIEYGEVSDKEGNVYKTVLIDNKTWLAENLKVTKYRNGDPIATTEFTKDISNELDPKYYWKFENKDSLFNIYGNLYTWYVLQDPRGVCPEGFRIPTDKDWVSLINSLDGNIVAGAKLKEVDFNHWMKPNANATNETGFTALPGGYRENDGKYYVLGFRGYWWSSKNNYVYIAWNTGLIYNNDILERIDFIKKNGLSVRCVK